MKKTLELNYIAAAVLEILERHIRSDTGVNAEAYIQEKREKLGTLDSLETLMWASSNLDPTLKNQLAKRFGAPPEQFAAAIKLLDQCM